MANLEELKARIIEAALEEARTHAAYSKAWDEDTSPYDAPLTGKSLETCTENLRAANALHDAGRALYAEMQKRPEKGQRGASSSQLEYRSRMLGVAP